MRYFLIDRVTELKVGEVARGIKNITLTDEVLHDHFSDYPIMPGALIVEGASQLAGFLLEMTLNKEGSTPKRALLVQIDKAKFHCLSGPGDQLIIETRIASLHETAARIDVKVTESERLIAKAKLTFMMKEIDSEWVHEQRRRLYKIWTRTWP